MGSYARVVRTLQPIIVPVCTALQNGLTASQEIHSDRNLRRRDDPWFYAHAARRIAVEELREKGLQAWNEDNDRPELGLSGILMYFQGLAVRVLRASLDEAENVMIPVPGRSKPRQAFWRQGKGLDQLPGMETDNILLLWHDKEGVLVDPMLLVRPLGGDHRRDSLRLDWQGKLSRGMASYRATDLDEFQPDVEYPEMGGKESG
ncbi:hypothetical protein [Sphaerimonospora mesophila]|uniref:hypothetical protein n=1 Tax=Sphaerimonospora mesophila TaxID=37483 RepID=UPI00128F0AB9